MMQAQGLHVGEVFGVAEEALGVDEVFVDVVEVAEEYLAPTPELVYAFGLWTCLLTVEVVEGGYGWYGVADAGV